MTQNEILLTNLMRPNLLIQTARIASKRYKRDIHLGRILPQSIKKTQEKLFRDLVEQENDMEWSRRSGSANYNVKRHISILAALMIEAVRETVS